jgi:Amt family ammonium transporter
LVWLSWNKLSKIKPFSKVDDALGVVHTHGVAGLAGGLLVGLFADPSIIVYLGSGSTTNVSYTGLLYGNPHQLVVQAGAALTVIIWDALITLIILRFLGLFMNLRLPDEVLETGDLAVHDEEAYPLDTLIRADGARPPAVPAGAAAAAAQQAQPTSPNPGPGD